jgi:hypothetical protein
MKQNQRDNPSNEFKPINHHVWLKNVWSVAPTRQT